MDVNSLIEKVPLDVWQCILEESDPHERAMFCFTNKNTFKLLKDDRYALSEDIISFLFADAIRKYRTKAIRWYLYRFRDIIHRKTWWLTDVYSEEENNIRYLVEEGHISIPLMMTNVEKKGDMGMFSWLSFRFQEQDSEVSNTTSLKSMGWTEGHKKKRVLHDLS